MGYAEGVPATDVVYLDHAATTALRPEVLDTMTAELARLGNPSSLHHAGRRARRVVEESREQIAEAVGARPSEVVFTSGGTEADNLAVKGLYWARRDADGQRRRVLTTGIEHHAVLDSVHWLARHEGARPDWLPVDAAGLLTPAALRAAIGTDTGDVALVSVMWANNEVGTVQPVAELAAVAHEHGIPFHSDAVQAAAQLPVGFAASGADALAITGHKLGGPVGVGALLLARQAEPVPVLHGGGQERDIRSGTLDTPAIAAFAVAVQLTVDGLAAEAGRITGLASSLIGQIQAAVPDAVLNGPPPGPAARQRALLLPRLRGRRAAHAAGREGDRLLHRVGLHRGGGAAQPRAAGHGRGGGPGPRLAAVLAWPHLYPGGRGRRRRGDRRGCGAGPPRGPLTTACLRRRSSRPAGRPAPGRSARGRTPAPRPGCPSGSHWTA